MGSKTKVPIQKESSSDKDWNDSSKEDLQENNSVEAEMLEALDEYQKDLTLIQTCKGSIERWSKKKYLEKVSSRRLFQTLNTESQRQTYTVVITSGLKETSILSWLKITLVLH